jgi:hypothetical protein
VHAPFVTPFQAPLAARPVPSCGVSKTVMLKDGDIAMKDGKVLEKQP